MAFQLQPEELPQLFEDIEAIFMETWIMLMDQSCFISPVKNLDFSGENVLATIQLEKDEKYVMYLLIPMRTAKKVTSYFYGAETASQEEILEAVGEIANIFAGNILSVLPGEWDMSLPDYKNCKGFSDNDRIFSRCFTSCLGDFHISLNEL